MEELIIKEKELRDAIEKAVAQSKLPAMMVMPIFKDALSQLQQAYEVQYNQSKAYIEEKENNKKGDKK